MVTGTYVARAILRGRERLVTKSDVRIQSNEQAEAREMTMPSRRAALRVAGSGALALAMLGVAGLNGRAIAQEATPTAERASKIGRYVVMRTRTVKADVSIDELNAIVSNGLAPLIRAIPGYVDYYVVQNEDTRERTAVSIFNDRAGIEESTRQAAEYLSGYPDYYEDLDPILHEGAIVVEAG